MDFQPVWEAVREGGAVGALVVMLFMLYREFRRVVNQRDRLFELLIKAVSSTDKATAVAESLVQDRSSGGLLG